MNTSTLNTDIVILGAGIGGYETFRTLNRLLKRAGLPQTITLVDQNNYFTFTPMLHEVAAGAIEPSHAAFPLREVVYGTPHRFLKARVENILPAEQRVITSAGNIAYRFCVVAIGSGINFFDTPGATEFCYTVRTLENAIRFRSELISALEGDNNELAVSVVGGGYTGIEVAAQLMYFFKHDVAELYPDKKISLRVIENNSTILPNLPASAQQRVSATLAHQGVEFLTNSKVSEVKRNRLVIGNRELVSDFTIWCAGVKHAAERFLAPPFQHQGQIEVNNFLQHPLSAGLYAVGDVARFCPTGVSTPLPPLGEVAHKQGEYVARHIVAQITQTKIMPFRFVSKGMLIPIGDWYGIIILGPCVFFGKIAWCIRRMVYLLFMPGILRKCKILIDWVLHSLGFRYTINIEK